MSRPIKVLAIVSGGDAPGINAALWHFARLCEAAGDTLFGAVEGFPGALDAPYIPLTSQLLAPHAALGGSYIATSREPVMRDPANRARFAERLRTEGIDGVLLFGGDGTLRHLPPLLANLGVRTIALPATIDNDVGGTERTLGFDSACNYAYGAIDGALATGRALPGRIFTIETLGGSTGHIALAVAHGAGAHAALVPEIPFDPDWLGARVRQALERDRYALIVHSEGIPEARRLPALIESKVGVRVRDVRLGHAQRGGHATHLDRSLAAEMAHLAHEALHSDLPRGVIVVRSERVLLHNGGLDGLPAPQPDRRLYNRVNGLD